MTVKMEYERKRKFLGHQEKQMSVKEVPKNVDPNKKIIVDVPSKKVVFGMDDTPLHDTIVNKTARFSLGLIPTSLLVRIFEKNTRLQRMKIAQTCWSAHNFLFNSQEYYKDERKRGPELKITLDKNEIDMRFVKGQNEGPVYKFPYSEYYLMEKYTFFCMPDDVTIDIDDDRPDFLESLFYIIKNAFCLQFGSIPSPEVGFRIASMAKKAEVLRFSQPVTNEVVTQYLLENPRFVSLWFINGSISDGDSIFELLHSMRRSMRKIVMMGSQVSGSCLLNFLRDSSYFSHHCLITIGKLRTTIVNRLEFDLEFHQQLEEQHHSFHFRLHGHNIILQCKEVQLVP